MQQGPRQNVSFPSNGSTAHGYLAVPDGGTGPGVIVIQEWWGLTDHIADIADRLAAAGFVALAPDLYGGRVTHDAAQAMDLMAQMPEGRAARDLSGAVDYLLDHPAVTSAALGAVGFCMGGGFVLLLASQQRERIGAAVAFYGVGPALENARAADVVAAVQGHYGNDDAFYPVADAKALESALRAGPAKEVDFRYYDAGHAFHNPDNLLGTYSPADAAVAWERTVAFLDAHLRP